MIYRVVAETFDIVLDEARQHSRLVSSGLRGAFSAGVNGAFDAVPTPRLENSRARFYFTELGWKRFGAGVLAAARAEGRAVRVIRRKNPARSQILYQDAYQIALLPRPLPSGERRRR